MSVPQIVVVVTRSSASVAPIWGMGLSWSSILPARTKTAALIVPRRPVRGASGGAFGAWPGRLAERNRCDTSALAPLAITSRSPCPIGPAASCANSAGLLCPLIGWSSTWESSPGWRVMPLQVQEPLRHRDEKRETVRQDYLPFWCRVRTLPLQVSNLDSPDPESGVLPVTPRGSSCVFLRFRRQQAI
jgi:hypothetical protein